MSTGTCLNIIPDEINNTSMDSDDSLEPGEVKSPPLHRTGQPENAVSGPHQEHQEINNVDINSGKNSSNSTSSMSINSVTADDGEVNKKMANVQTSKTASELEALKCKEKVRAILELDAQKRKEQMEERKRELERKRQSGELAAEEEMKRKAKEERKLRRKLEKEAKKAKSSIDTDMDSEASFDSKSNNRRQKLQNRITDEDNDDDRVDGRDDNLYDKNKHVIGYGQRNSIFHGTAVNGLHFTHDYVQGVTTFPYRSNAYTRGKIHHNYPYGHGFYWAHSRGGYNAVSQYRHPLYFRGPRPYTTIGNTYNQKYPIKHDSHNSTHLPPAKDLLWTKCKPSISYAFNFISRSNKEENIPSRSSQELNQDKETRSTSKYSTVHKLNDKGDTSNDKQYEEGMCDQNTPDNTPKSDYNYTNKSKLDDGEHTKKRKKVKSNPNTKPEMDDNSRKIESKYDFIEVEEAANSSPKSEKVYKTIDEVLLGDETKEGSKTISFQGHYDDKESMFKEDANLPVNVFDVGNNDLAIISNNTMQEKNPMERNGASSAPQKLIVNKIPIPSILEVQKRIDEMLGGSDLDISDIEEKKNTLIEKTRKHKYAKLLKQNQTLCDDKLQNYSLIPLNEQIQMKSAEPTEDKFTPEKTDSNAKEVLEVTMRMNNDKNQENVNKKVQEVCEDTHVADEQISKDSITRKHLKEKNLVNKRKKSKSKNRHHRDDLEFVDSHKETNGGKSHKSVDNDTNVKANGRNTNKGVSEVDNNKPSKEIRKNSDRPQWTIGKPISFAASEFLFPEESQTSDENFENNEQQVVFKSTDEFNINACLDEHTTLGSQNNYCVSGSKDEESPNTDDYIDNWENDDIDYDYQMKPKHDMIMNSLPMERIIDNIDTLNCYMNPSPPRDGNDNEAEKAMAESDQNNDNEGFSNTLPSFGSVIEDTFPNENVLDNTSLSNDVYNQYMKSSTAESIKLEINETSHEEMLEENEVTDDNNKSAGEDTSNLSPVQEPTESSTKNQLFNVRSSISFSLKSSSKLQKTSCLSILSESSSSDSDSKPSQSVDLKQKSATNLPGPTEGAKSFNVGRSRSTVYSPPPNKHNSTSINKSVDNLSDNEMTSTSALQESMTDLSKDFKKLKSLDSNLNRLEKLRANYGSVDDLSEELYKIELLLIKEKKLILQKYSKTFPSSEQRQNSSNNSTDISELNTKTNSHSLPSQLPILVSTNEKEIPVAIDDFSIDSLSKLQEDEMKEKRRKDNNYVGLRYSKSGDIDLWPSSSKSSDTHVVRRKKDSRESTDRVRNRKRKGERDHYSKHGYESERERNYDHHKGRERSKSKTRRNKERYSSGSRSSQRKYERSESNRRMRFRSPSESHSSDSEEYSNSYRSHHYHNKYKQNERSITPSSPKRSERNRSPKRSRSSRSPRMQSFRSLSRKRCHSPQNRDSRSPLPFKPPSPPMSPKSYNSDSMSPISQRRPRSPRSPCSPRSSRYSFARHNRRKQQTGSDDNKRYKRRDSFMSHSKYGSKLDKNMCIVSPGVAVPKTYFASQAYDPLPGTKSDFLNSNFEYCGNYYGGCMHVPLANGIATYFTTPTFSDEMARSPVFRPYFSSNSTENKNSDLKASDVQHVYSADNKIIHTTPQKVPSNVSGMAVQKGNVLEIVPSIAESLTYQDRKTPGERTENKRHPHKSKEKTAVTEPEDNPTAKRFKSHIDDMNSCETGRSTRLIDVKTDVGSPKSADKKITALRGILKRKNKCTPKKIPKKEKHVMFSDGISTNCDSDEDDRNNVVTSIRKKLLKLRMKYRTEMPLLYALPDSERNIPSSDLLTVNLPAPPPPPNAPPVNIQQPLYVKPVTPSPLLYFHYDKVVKSMYISPIEDGVPPRKLNANCPPSSGTNIHTAGPNHQHSHQNSYRAPIPHGNTSVPGVRPATTQMHYGTHLGGMPNLGVRAPPIPPIPGALRFNPKPTNGQYDQLYVHPQPPPYRHVLNSDEFSPNKQREMSANRINGQIIDVSRVGPSYGQVVGRPLSSNYGINIPTNNPLASSSSNPSMNATMPMSGIRTNVKYSPPGTSMARAARITVPAANSVQPRNSQINLHLPPPPPPPLSPAVSSRPTYHRQTRRNHQPEYELSQFMRYVYYS